MFNMLGQALFYFSFLFLSHFIILVHYDIAELLMFGDIYLHSQPKVDNYPISIKFLLMAHLYEQQPLFESFNFHLSCSQMILVSSVTMKTL